MPNPRSAEQIFSEACRLAGVEREAYLRGACGDDAALRSELESLLRADADTGSFLKDASRTPAPANATDDPDATVLQSRPIESVSSTTERAGLIIGRYKLLQLIGEGGFGSVWAAEQEKPVVRKVALKIIKLGMDTRQVVARFEQERQALALMDHPNIAKVLDAGATEAGRPYFVMELCKGDPIHEYCDKNNLSIEDRLELFAQVCTAVQHAHTKGIIHRDIKPSNILVSTQDGRPLTKVIDFGIAKATASKLTEKTLFTEHRQLIGTPEYMSPEQAEGSLDIDTRTDVYSLGVLLYELLTGTTPFSSQELRSAAYAEIQRIIREVEPPKPSTRLSHNTDTIASVAARRHTEPKRLGTLVRGELDWIVMKALEKDRQRRYETANGLAMDVRRYLSGEAVVAAPPSTVYRFKKFVRRNKGQVIAVSVVLLALIGGVVGTSIGMVRANQAAEKERRATELTAARLKQIELINNTVFDIFAEFDIEKAKQSNDPVEYVLSQKLIEAGRKLDEKAIEDPIVLANLKDRLGRTLLNLGQASAAAELIAAAIDIRKAQLGPDHPDTLVSMSNLALCYHAFGRHTEAVTLTEEVLGRRRATLGPDHPDTLASMLNLGFGYACLGRASEAMALNEETLKLQKATLGPDHPNTLVTMGNLAGNYLSFGRFTEGLALWEETLRRRQATLGPDHPHTLGSMNYVAISLAALGRHTEALAMFEQTLKLRRSKLGPDHPDTVFTMERIAASYAVLGQHEEALAIREETLKLRQAKLGPDHPSTLLSLYYLAESCAALGRNKKSLELCEEALAICQKRVATQPANPRHQTDLAIAHLFLGRAYSHQNRPVEALTLLDAGHAILQKLFEAGAQDTANGLLLGYSHAYRGAARIRAGQPAEAAVDLRRSLELWANVPNLDTKDKVERLRSLALLAGLGAEEKSGVTKDDARAFADQSIAAIADVIKTGWADLAELKQPDFDAIRDRADFKTLVTEAQAKREKQP